MRVRARAHIINGDRWKRLLAASAAKLLRFSRLAAAQRVLTAALLSAITLTDGAGTFPKTGPRLDAHSDNRLMLRFTLFFADRWDKRSSRRARGPLALAMRHKHPFVIGYRT